MFLLAGLAHHGEPGDPDLLVWIRDQIDAVVGLGATGMVIVLGAVIVAVPLAIMAVFLVHRARRRRA
jgi:hypothetical protein